MVSKMDIVDYFKKHNEVYQVSEDHKMIVNKENGQTIDLDDFLDIYRKKTGQSFDCIYNLHACLFNVLRCTECGTVIFEYDDERYEPQLACPTCTDYKTGFEFWTQADIDADSEKQKQIDWYKEMDKLDHERYIREKKRGKTDQEILKFDIPITKKRRLAIRLCCNDITVSYLKGLKIDWHFWIKDEDGLWLGKNFHWIPLTPGGFYIKWIFPHTKKYKEFSKSMGYNI